MSAWIFGVYGGGTGNTRDDPASNACVFATEAEAERAGRELLRRWTQPSAFVVLPAPAGARVNYVFPADAHRPSRREAP